MVLTVTTVSPFTGYGFIKNDDFHNGISVSLVTYTVSVFIRC